jgi:hypothetical protein
LRQFFCNDKNQGKTLKRNENLRNGIVTGRAPPPKYTHRT